MDITQADGQHHRFSGNAVIGLECNLTPGDPRTTDEVFAHFKKALLERISVHNQIEDEGEGIIFAYRNLISSLGRFLSTFPKIEGIPIIESEQVEADFRNNPALAKALIGYLRTKFDEVYARAYALDASSLPAQAKHIEQLLGEVASDEARTRLKTVFALVRAIEETDVFSLRRTPEAVAFRLNHSIVQQVADSYRITYPTDITYVYMPRTGSYAIGARFGGKVSKGGDRYYPTTATEGRVNFGTINRRALEEALRLAWTQEVKNILWACYVNGLKTVLVAAPLAEIATDPNGGIVPSHIKYPSNPCFYLTIKYLLFFDGVDGGHFLANKIT
ncbi:hypothetical protein HZB07_06695 [Candidatus Saganbacteria bacterium]|nr:hypothetical protein [Candidatus Saganbacteria bacterium]